MTGPLPYHSGGSMSFLEERSAVIQLHLIPDIGPKRFRSLVARFGSAAGALKASPGEISQIPDMPASIAGRICAAADGAGAAREQEEAASDGVRIITCIDEDYPSCFVPLPDAPVVIYVK